MNNTSALRTLHTFLAVTEHKSDALFRFHLTPKNVQCGADAVASRETRKGQQVPVALIRRGASVHLKQAAGGQERRQRCSALISQPIVVQPAGK